MGAIAVRLYVKAATKEAEGRKKGEESWPQKGCFFSKCLALKPCAQNKAFDIDKHEKKKKSEYQSFMLCFRNPTIHHQEEIY